MNSNSVKAIIHFLILASIFFNACAFANTTPSGYDIEQIPSSTPKIVAMIEAIPTENTKPSPTIPPKLTQDSEPIVMIVDRYVAPSGQPFIITVSNNSNSLSLATYDHKSLCSIFTIQKKIRNTWINVLECSLRKPTSPVLILPGESISLAFNGGSNFLDPGSLDPGLYRVAFMFKWVNDVPELWKEDLRWQMIFSHILEVQ